LAYAVAEGVGFGLRDGLDTLALCPTDALSVVGGGTRSVWWLQLLASIFQRNLQLLSGAQTGAALGAARLGWLATLPQTDESIAHVCIPPKVEMTFTPASVDHSILNERYQRFRALYQATKHLM
jgi:xylulokinase